MKPTPSPLSIWFLIGIALVVNGVLIAGAGLYELFDPPPVRLILFQLHAGIWWGAILALAGALFCFFHSPGRNRAH